MSGVEQGTSTYLYLEGDSSPVATTLSVEQVAAAVDEARRLAGVWVRLPTTDGREALFRERVIVAIVPEGGDE